jgi:hypothetical protein
MPTGVVSRRWISRWMGWGVLMAKKIAETFAFVKDYFHKLFHNDGYNCERRYRKPLKWAP